VNRTFCSHLSAFEIKYDWEAVMTRSDLEKLSNDELWDMHHNITATLKAKIKAKKKVLEHRLAQLQRTASRRVD
jgi:hypothetical protein